MKLIKENIFIKFKNIIKSLWRGATYNKFFVIYHGK